MARSEARIRCSIWDDDHYRSLPFEAQWLYEAILSQKDLSLCGVLTWTPKRFVKLAANASPKMVRDALKALVDGRYVVLDESTDELWVRTFVRHDRVIDSPNMVLAMSHDFGAIHSTRIREGLVEGLGEGFLEGLPQRFPKGLPKGFMERLGKPFLEGVARVPPCAPVPPSSIPIPPASSDAAEGFGGEYEPVAPDVAEEDDGPRRSEHPPSVAAVARLVAERRLARQRPGSVRTQGPWLAKTAQAVADELGPLIASKLADGAEPEAVAAVVDPDPDAGPVVEMRTCCRSPVGGEHLFRCSKGRTEWDVDADGNAVRAGA